MFPSLGFGEILLIMLIVLLVFGPKKLPELARGLGRAMNEFRRAADDVKRELEANEINDPPKKKLPIDKTEQSSMADSDGK